MLFICSQYGRTEWQQNTLNPRFTTAIQMDYRFEEVQTLWIAVYDIDNGTKSLLDDDFLGAIDCTLGEVGVALQGWYVCACVSYFGLDCEFHAFHSTAGDKRREEIQESQGKHNREL